MKPLSFAARRSNVAVTSHPRPRLISPMRASTKPQLLALLAAGGQPQAFAKLFRDRHLTLASELCLERSQLRGNREVSGSPAFLDLPYSVATALKACQDVVLGAAGGLADIIHRCAFRPTEHPLSDLGSRPVRLHVTFPYLLLYISILF